jgi:ABC-2 type transport system ATP-binding protein
MNVAPAIEVKRLVHRYGDRTALRDVNFTIDAGEVFAFLGPNGGGKTTLFRILATVHPPQAGEVQIAGLDVTRQLYPVRARLGVVFQANSLDKKLTVDENIAQQGALYGLHGRTLRQRRDEVVAQLGLEAQRGDRVETLSGGYRRRADLAKTLIHRPEILLLDEPTTGLDPGARSDLWRYLRQLRSDHGMTIVLTSHLLEEADRADRVAILHEGQLVAQGDPGQLRAEMGGDSVTIETDAPEELCEAINGRWHCEARVVDRDVRFACPADRDWWIGLRETFPDQVKSVKLGRPTLEDVFIQKTGHLFWQQDAVETVRKGR